MEFLTPYLDLVFLQPFGENQEMQDILSLFLPLPISLSFYLPTKRMKEKEILKEKESDS